MPNTIKIIYVPGFWDIPTKFENLSEILRKQNPSYKVLNYRDYKKYGNTLDKETFQKIFEDITQNNFQDKLVLTYSMGAAFVYDYFNNSGKKPYKLIMVDPLLENITNPFKSSFLRICDMFLQGQLWGAIKTSRKGLFPLMDIAIAQNNYLKHIEFNKKLNFHATFVWATKDLICPIEKYTKYKNLFCSSKLIRVENHHHNWLVYKAPVKKYLVPELI